MFLSSTNSKFILIRLLNPFSTREIPQSLNINHLRTTSTNFIKQHTTKKLIEYSLKTFFKKTMFTITVFEILLFEGRLVLLPAQRSTGTERVKIQVKNQKNIRII